MKKEQSMVAIFALFHLLSPFATIKELRDGSTHEEKMDILPSKSIWRSNGMILVVSAWLKITFLCTLHLAYNMAWHGFNDGGGGYLCILAVCLVARLYLTGCLFPLLLWLFKIDSPSFLMLQSI
jgi:hypothetical protein